MAKYLGLRGSSLSAAIAVVSSLCFFLFGYDQGDLAGLLTLDSFLIRFPQVDTIHGHLTAKTAAVTGVTVGSWNLGCFLSAMLTIILGDRFGRKTLIMTGIVFLMIGEIIQASSYSFGQLIAGRVIAGFGNGFNAATVPAYQAECSKPHRKGTLLMISASTCIAAGLAFGYWMDFAFAWLDPSSASWRVPIAMQLIFALAALALIAVMPESPRWLILQGREKAALEVLATLNNTTVDSNDVHQSFLQIKDAVLEMSKSNFSATFHNGDYRHLHRTLLAFMLQVMQQMSGINLITQYFALMFVNQYLYTTWVARLLAACAGTAFFLASFVAVVGIDRFWGRRSLMMFGATGMCVTMIILAILNYVHTGGALIAGSVFLFVFGVFFAIGWQGMAWLYQVEIVPLRIRGPANALSTAANWLVNYVVVQITPSIFRNIQWKTYIVFAVTNAVTVPLIYFLYPETGHRTLEEVDMIFHQASMTPRPWLTVVRIAKDEPLWYGKDGEDSFDYSKSSFHERHVRFSDETTSSEGEQGRLRGAAPGAVHTSSSSEDMSVTQGRRSSDQVPPVPPLPHHSSSEEFNEKADTYEAAPAPTVYRTSMDQQRARSTSRPRSSRSAKDSGRGW
ncbi:hypothetical protein K431DRAFT_244120 [Polychaeton citri CBS 116435]|uniref:Major facilitator superfamily (MFS) profile domain-containing protein n=1 Tax=Polychaeton citri CBS 116435 TaxID=1314669 RepID=A0A9P4QAU3_9PEZI|nr:hypothetical protein K431DRAFT_244120 [Polychaeton citri CBS 116435]